MTSSNKKKNVKKNKISEANDNLRKIDLKNYIILGIIFIITLIIVFGLRSWYISYENYQLTIPVLKGKIKEVTDVELDNYLTENPDAILYIEVSEDANSREVADDLYNVVKKRNLIERVVYINLSATKDKTLFLKNFSEKYITDKIITNYPALILFDDGSVESFVSRTSKQRLNIGDIEQLFDQYELEGE